MLQQSHVFTDVTEATTVKVKMETVTCDPLSLRESFVFTSY